jgi:hypothetical protein
LVSTLIILGFVTAVNRLLSLLLSLSPDLALAITAA